MQCSTSFICFAYGHVDQMGGFVLAVDDMTGLCQAFNRDVGVGAKESV